MAQQISPIIPGAMANAGTSSRIAPRKGGFFQKLGAGIESLVNTAAPMISPDVREFEKFRMDQEESRIKQGLDVAQAERFRGEEERKRQEFDRDNRFIDLDTALSTTTPSVRKYLEQEAEDRLLIETDPNTGKKGIRFGAGSKFLEGVDNRVINKLAIQDHSVSLSGIQKNIEKETSKMAKEIQNLDPSIGEMRAMEMVQANMQNPANQSEELRRAFDDQKFYNEKINALVIENESLDSAKAPSAFQEKINALIPIVGEEEAVKIATGLISAAIDPITKEKVRFDLSQVNTAIDTSSIPDNQKAELKLLSDKASGMTLWEASDLSTGVRSGARNAYNKLSSLTGLPPALATEGARTQLQTAGIALTTALSDNSRYPEGLRKWILSQTDIQPSIFQSPKLLRQNFITLDTVLKNEILKEVQSQQLGTLSPKEIIESNIKLREMNNFREMMGVPGADADGTQGEAGLLDVPSDIEEILNKSSGTKIGFNPSGSDYDYATAKKLGIERDDTGHLPSFSGEDPNMLLKGINHPTIGKTFEGEERMGNKIIQKGNRFFSVPKSAPGKAIKLKEIEELKKKVGASGLIGDFGFNVRDKLFPSEEEFYRKNTHVSGMFNTESDDITINPFSSLNQKQKQAVARLESFRGLMFRENIVPDFELTQKQLDFLASTKEPAYMDGGKLAKQTIASRIFVGDPSAQDVTDEQRAWVSKFLRGK